MTRTLTTRTRMTHGQAIAFTVVMSTAGWVLIGIVAEMVTG